MNRRTRALLAVARRVRHPEPPTPRYLARMRFDPPAPLSQAMFGRWPAGIGVRNFTVPGPVPLPCRRYAPIEPGPASAARPLVVNFHGGGFVTGSLASTDWLCAQVSARTGAVVVSVGYRLAPEHPAPAAYEDAELATQWLLEHAADLGADSERAAVMGTSAGGTLAALVALRHRDLGRSDRRLAPLRFQVLIYPATDLTLSSPSVLEFADAPILTRATLDWYGRRYLPRDVPEPIAYDDPRVSPLHATDHRDLAPALIIAAGQDPLRDDATRYAAVLEQAGVPVRLVTYPDALHGFATMPRLQPDARLALDEIATALANLAG